MSLATHRDDGCAITGTMMRVLDALQRGRAGRGGCCFAMRLRAQDNTAVRRAIVCPLRSQTLWSPRLRPLSGDSGSGAGSSGGGGDGGGSPVVVSRELLSARPAAPRAAADHSAAPPRASPTATLFDELDELPASASLLRTKSDDPSGAAAADPAGRGLVSRILQEGSEQLDPAPDGTSDWSLGLSSTDRVAALEQIREELDFDTLFDEDVQEVAKLTAHELAELEKTRFGHGVGDTPDWGMPGPAPLGTPLLRASCFLLSTSMTMLLVLYLRGAYGGCVCNA
jgi:hypothetical protein